MLCERSCHKVYTYEIPICNGWKDITKVKVFVHATKADVDADTSAMTQAPQARY